MSRAVSYTHLDVYKRQGFDCAVASLGTALTPDHAQLLARFTKEAVIAYDGDGAGVSAAQRAIPILEKTGIQVKVLRMQGALSLIHI